ncbi:hypothetical protein [Micromonospora sediminimaris]|uniref:Uncharacterized protein n=1 Tax=Micromonospora sediminimaris TaxID=547162 RepID=A0A9W5UP25_9ACTN|nr:hypothetical protein [Micromonospora sediminimaris]GIJ31556.1 hypothetical protein Vse01_07040 [Micromonospora sediminimaris]SFC36496.1 hypothetical protein SAMN05216284_10489 [Micromonospora sediminimaris]
MNVAAIVGGGLALFIAVAALVHLGRRRATPYALGRSLRLLALGVTLGLAVAMLPATVSDSGAATGYLLGVPTVVALLPLGAELAGRLVGVATTLAAIVMLAWGLLLGLGDGVYFVIPALILGAAAVASITPRRGIPASDYRNRPRTRS